jgi:pimeloyl-ACP methyl ester carboxylesterase
MATPEVRRFAGRDGIELAYRELGSGRALVLIHGFFSDANTTWLRSGHARYLAERGRRVIMPDLRGHGDSAKPHDAASYPPDVLTDDGLALIAHLGVEDYDLCGYSLGGRTTIRMLVRGAAPARAVVAGIGMQGIASPAGRNGRYGPILENLGTFKWGTLEWRAEQFLERIGGDPQALLRVLDVSLGTSPEELARLTTPTLVLTGAEDPAGETAGELAAALADGRRAEVPGDHTSALRGPELGRGIAAFLEQ